MVKDELEWLARFPCQERRVYFSPPGRRKECLRLAPAKGALRRLSFYPQGPGDLGRRLAQAFRETLRAFPSSVIVGSDAPRLGPSVLAKAFLALRRNDLVVGPARDGGYYLLGLRRFSPDLFRGIPWSTGKVFELTVKRARQSGLSTFVLPQLGDVDTMDDLSALTQELDLLIQVPGIDPFPARTFREISRLRRRAKTPTQKGAVFGNMDFNPFDRNRLRKPSRQ
jgi:rSAM/selenodomain-associated transferase 1